MWRLITDNIALKFLSLVVAVLLWLAVQGDADTTTMVAVRMQYRNIPAELEISTIPAEIAYLEVRGPGARLNAINLNNAIIALDLGKHQTPGEKTYLINEDSVHLPPGVTFLRAVPSQVRIELESRLSKEVKVTPRYAGVPDGYSVDELSVTPDRLRVTGPRSHVMTVDHVETDVIDLGKGGDSVLSVVTPVYAPDPLVHLEQRLVTVRIKVKLQKVR